MFDVKDDRESDAVAGPAYTVGGKIVGLSNQKTDQAGQGVATRNETSL